MGNALNTFINAPHLLDASLQLKKRQRHKLPIPLFVAGQFGGTEGYCEAIASGLWVALGVCAYLKGESLSPLPKETAFGALLAYAKAKRRSTINQCMLILELCYL